LHLTGTYRAVARVEWTVLLSKEFGSPDWNALYPVHPDKKVFNDVDKKFVHTDLLNKGQLLSPRMACKLFHDGLYIIKKGEESPKFVQDRIPEVCHKHFKKKQWRKQFYEGMRRVCCRLAIGLGFRPNCLAEDAFIHAILGMGFELGWKRIHEYTNDLPEWDRDRDFSRVAKFGSNEDVGNLLKGVESTGGAKKDKAGGIDVSKVDVKLGWFRCYDVSAAHMFDHIVRLEDDETDNWSAASSMGSMDSHDLDMGPGRLRSDSVRSDISIDEDGADSTTRPRSGSAPKSPASRKARGMSNLEPTEENAVYHTASVATADASLSQVVAGIKIKQ
jgi:hypothetical protein